MRGRRTESLFGNETSGRDNLGSGEFAVQSDAHQSAGAQKLEQLAPPGFRIKSDGRRANYRPGDG